MGPETETLNMKFTTNVSFMKIFHLHMCGILPALKPWQPQFDALNPILAEEGQICPTKPVKHWTSARNKIIFLKLAWLQYLNLPKDFKMRRKNIGFALVAINFWWFTTGRENLPFPGHLGVSGSLARIRLMEDLVDCLFWTESTFLCAVFSQHPHYNAPFFGRRQMAHYIVDVGQKAAQKLEYICNSLANLKVMEYLYYCFPGL